MRFLFSPGKSQIHTFEIQSYQLYVERTARFKRTVFLSLALLAPLVAIFLNWAARYHFRDLWLKILVAAVAVVPLALLLQSARDRFFDTLPRQVPRWVLLISALLILLLPSGAHFILFLMLLVLAGIIIFYRFRFDIFLPAPVADRKVSYEVVAFYVTACLMILLMLRAAWIAEDAFITFRTVRNFLDGFGLRYNIYERVQSYTHPLWFFVISAVVSVTQEYQYTVAVFSVFLSLVTVALATRFFHYSWPVSAVFLGLLFCSKAFIDYTSSGLENPLSYFLVMMVYVFWFNYRQREKRFFLLCLFSALLATNRHDLGLLAAPLLLVDFVQLFRLRPASVFKLVLLAVAGFSPLILWTLFSLVYYGFPFPNTAYAKLNTGIPRAEYLQQGVAYFLDSVKYDPVTLVSIVCVVITAVFYKTPRTLVPLVGIALYFVYILRIGGDFMSGRFFSVPFFCAAMVFLQVKPGKTSLTVLCSVFVLLALANPYSPLKYYFPLSEDSQAVRQSGVADERSFFYEYNALMNYQRVTPANENPWQQGGRWYADSTWRVQPWGNIGMLGFYTDNDIHILDFLSDPLLARLPMDKKNLENWRIGHFYREIPAGYIESLTYLDNRIEDPALHEYYDHLRVLVQDDDLFGKERLKEIVRFNLGRYDHLVKHYRYPEQ